MTPAALLVLRLLFALPMAIAHGAPKLQNLLAGDYGFPDPLGLGSAASLALATGAELLGAALVAVGLFTRPAAASVVVTMAVAAFVTHGGDPFSKMEPALLYGAGFLAIALLGPGAYSIDARRGGRRGGR